MLYYSYLAKFTTKKTPKNSHLNLAKIAKFTSKTAIFRPKIEVFKAKIAKFTSKIAIFRLKIEFP